MKGIVDRIVENVVVLEVGGEMVDINRDYFPKELEEGDIVEKRGEKFFILEEETKKRDEYIKKLFDDLVRENKDD